MNNNNNNFYSRNSSSNKNNYHFPQLKIYPKTNLFKSHFQIFQIILINKSICKFLNNNNYSSLNKHFRLINNSNSKFNNSNSLN